MPLVVVIHEKSYRRLQFNLTDVDAVVDSPFVIHDANNSHITENVRFHIFIGH